MTATWVMRSTAPRAAAAQLDIEQAIFERLAHSPPRLRLWQPLPALIATLTEANSPDFASAAARAAARGWPVAVRRSGGGAVCLGPGSLVVSHFYRSSRNDIDLSYRQFAQVLTTAVADLDVALNSEHVVGAYCDGRYDLAWQGRKVGGIAQRRAWRDGMAHVWIHAVLAVDAEALRYPQAVSDFYADLGSSRVADPRTTTTLSRCFADPAGRGDLSCRLGDAIVRAFAARSCSCVGELL